MNICFWVILAVGAVSAQPVAAAAQLLIATGAGVGCDIALWSPRDRMKRDLVHLEECPEKLFTSTASANVFYSTDKAIFQISTTGATESGAIAQLPDLTFGTFARWALSRPLSNYENMTASSIMEVRNAGMSDDGVLWVHVGLVMAGDDDYDFLIRLVDDNWVLQEFMHCGRFGLCEFSAFNKNESGDAETGAAPELWDPMIKENTFFVRDEFSPGDASNHWTGKIDRYFEIDGEQVLLEVWTGKGPDSGFPYTAGAVIHRNKGDSLPICEQQCWATLSGQFLLARRFWGGTLELYDIATGDSVLGPMKFATWAILPENVASPR